MKFNELVAIDHNIADSLGSGIGLLIGVYEMDDFGEASRNPEGFITADFLTGKTSGCSPSPSLANAIQLYRHSLGELCEKHGTSPAVFRELSARYSCDAVGRRLLVTVADHQGHRSEDEYIGTPARRIRTFDKLGRVRKK